MPRETTEQVQLHRYAERLRALRDIHSAILTAQSPKLVAQGALARVRILIPCFRASVTLFDWEAQETDQLAVECDEQVPVTVQKNNRIAFGLHPHVTLATFRQGQVVVEEDLLAIAHPPPLFQEIRTRVRSYLSAPLIVQGNLIGALHLAAIPPHAFLPEHQDIAHEIATSLAIVLQQARLNEAARRHAEDLEEQVTERTAALRTLNTTLEQRVAERTHSLQESEDRYRDLFDNASDLIATMTLDGVLTAVNRSVQHYLGYTSEEVLGKNWRELTTPASIALIDERLSHAMGEETDPPMYEFEALHQDGRTVPFEGRVRYIRDAAGHPVGLHGVYRDITQRKEVDRLKTELISTVSHELRTPLTSLRGFTELLLTREFTPSQQRDMVSIIHQESSRLTTLINDFLDIQRITEGQQSYTFESVDLNPLLHEAIAVFSAGQEQHPFQVALQTPLPLVHADPNRVRQVLRNLLSNAIKYTPDGGPVSVGARRDGEEVVAWITDQGIGIPTEALPHLFTKFFRVDNTATRQIGGTGLGLALVKEIVNAHNGRVWVESTFGKGSTFFFALPLTADRAMSPLASPVSP
jgi:PAS domain S-box-containing protein